MTLKSKGAWILIVIWLALLIIETIRSLAPAPAASLRYD